MSDGDPVKGWMVIAVLTIASVAVLYTLYQWIQLLRLRARLKRENPDAVAGLQKAFRLLGFRHKPALQQLRNGLQRRFQLVFTGPPQGFVQLLRQ